MSLKGVSEYSGDGVARLDRAPPEHARAVLPADFGRRFLTFVDTEEEFDWQEPRSRDSTSTYALNALPVAHRRLRDFGIIPAYLADYPVVNSVRGADLLRAWQESGECTIGAQLHPWVNPPFVEDLTVRNSFVGNLPIEYERAKLLELTRKIEQTFGRHPLVYRAGRYGVGPNTAGLLEEAGYRMDVSVRSLFEYRREEGPDFSLSPAWPWWAGPRGQLVEVPLTATYVGLLRGSAQRVFPYTSRIPLVRAVLARARLMNRVALTPEGMPLGEVLEALRVLLDDGIKLFSISFHSPSVEPGHTPYIRDGSDLRRFYAWWDGVLDFFARENVLPTRIEEVIGAFQAGLASGPAAPLSPPVLGQGL